MTNHPNRSPRNRSVYLVRSGENGVTSDVVASGLTNTQAMDKAKKLAGAGATFIAHYGPTSCAYAGTEVTAVVSW